MSVKAGIRPIYLDYCATTPVDSRVIEAFIPYLGEHFGNPASQSHLFGREAADAVERARSNVGQLLGCEAEEVIWTSGATESNNLAVKWLTRELSPRPHVITQATEHKAILDPVRSLEGLGVDVTVLDVDQHGRLDPELLRRAIRPETRLVSVMWANNETGTLMPIAEAACICADAKVVFHCDASQAVGKIPINLRDINIDLLSLSGHKFYGPKGVGALVFRRGPKLRTVSPLIEGGGHERGIRSGTLNVPGIVGMGEAARLAIDEIHSEGHRIAEHRDAFERSLSKIGGIEVNGAVAHRLPNVSNVSFLGVDAESLLIALEGVAASTGSACTAASLEPSHVLRAMGLPANRQRSAVRFSFGRQTTQQEIEQASSEIKDAVTALRALSTVLI